MISARCSRSDIPLDNSPTRLLMVTFDPSRKCSNTAFLKSAWRLANSIMACSTDNHR